MKNNNTGQPFSFRLIDKMYHDLLSQYSPDEALYYASKNARSMGVGSVVERMKICAAIVKRDSIVKGKEGNN